MQATCVRALERADQFEPGSRLESWLFAILDSIWRNQHRANGVRQGNGIVDIADTDLPSGDASEEVRMRMVDVQRAIAGLTPDQRTVLLLITAEGFSYSETAAILDIPIGTVMSRLAAARSNVRDKAGRDL